MWWAIVYMRNYSPQKYGPFGNKQQAEYEALSHFDYYRARYNRGDWPCEPLRYEVVRM